MKALRCLIGSLALCSLFASSLALADDCSDALMAESCACRSAVKSEREQLRRSETGSSSARQSKASKRAGTRVAQRPKTDASSDR
jgi:hypothetical protein